MRNFTKIREKSFDLNSLRISNSLNENKLQNNNNTKINHISKKFFSSFLKVKSRFFKNQRLYDGLNKVKMKEILNTLEVNKNKQNIILNNNEFFKNDHNLKSVNKIKILKKPTNDIKNNTVVRTSFLENLKFKFKIKSTTILNGFGIHKLNN